MYMRNDEKNYGMVCVIIGKSEYAFGTNSKYSAVNSCKDDRLVEEDGTKSLKTHCSRNSVCFLKLPSSPTSGQEQCSCSFVAELGCMLC